MKKPGLRRVFLSIFNGSVSNGQSFLYTIPQLLIPSSFVLFAGVLMIHMVNANPKMIITNPAITLVIVARFPLVTELIITSTTNSANRYMCLLKIEKYLRAMV